MATVKKYQKGGLISTVKKAAAKAVETVKKTAPKSIGDPANLSKTAGQKFLSKDKVEMKNGGKTPKAQNGKQVPIPKKFAPKGADNKIKSAFESGMKKYNDSSVLKSTKTYKSGGKVAKKKK